MAKYTSVLHQLLRHVPRDEFRAIVERHQGDKGVRKLSCWGQFVALFFGQLTGQHSLRDLITTLDAGRKKLQQVGLGAVSRSTLADANRKRPQEIFGELFGCLYQRCRRQAPGQRFGFRHRVYSLDATVIDLCLKVFDWAKFRKRKGAIKLHLILDHGGHIPSFCVMTPGREHEIEVARGQRYEPDSILSFDRAYVDYHWFDQLHRQGVYFVTRQKRNARYRVLERRSVVPQPGVTSDQVIRLTGKAAQCLSTPLRRIGYRDPETRQFYVFLTNLFHLTAAEVAAIYKARWANRAVLQMGQAAPEDQELSGDHGQCGDDPGLGGAVCVPAGGLREVSAAAPRAPVRDFQALTGHGPGVPGSGSGVGLGSEKRAKRGTKVETAELVRKTAKAFVCRGIGVE